MLQIVQCEFDSAPATASPNAEYMELLLWLCYLEAGMTSSGETSVAQSLLGSRASTPNCQQL